MRAIAREQLGPRSRLLRRVHRSGWPRRPGASQQLQLHLPRNRAVHREQRSDLRAPDYAGRVGYEPGPALGGGGWIEYLHVTDSSSARLPNAGDSGLFDYYGASVELDEFWLSALNATTSGGSGGTGGGTGGGTTPEFADDFNHTGRSDSWFVESGSFSDNGSAAVANGGNESYAFWTGSPGANDTAAITLATPLVSTYAGVIVRGAGNLPYRDHYVAYVDPNGQIDLARRNAYSYSYLADGPKFPSGSHVLAVTATGSSPVTLSVTIDCNEVIHDVDSSSSALKSAGKAGLLDYFGKGQPFDRFTVTAH